MLTNLFGIQNVRAMTFHGRDAETNAEVWKCELTPQTDIHTDIQECLREISIDAKAFSYPLGPAFDRDFSMKCNSLENMKGILGEYMGMEILHDPLIKEGPFKVLHASKLQLRGSCRAVQSSGRKWGVTFLFDEEEIDSSQFLEVDAIYRHTTSGEMAAFDFTTNPNKRTFNNLKNRNNKIEEICLRLDKSMILVDVVVGNHPYEFQRCSSSVYRMHLPCPMDQMNNLADILLREKNA